MSDNFERERKSQETEAREHNVLTLKNIILAGVGLVVVIGLVFLMVSVIYPNFISGQEPEAIASPPGPNLQVAPNEELQAYLEREQARLNSFAVEGGRAVIPIDRAMALVAEQGLPSFAGVEGIDEPLDASVAEGIPEGAGEAAEAGAQAFQAQGCNGCHQEQDSATAPTLVGIFGTEETLEGGETVPVDEEYIEESILQPNAKVVEGFQPIMPSYEGRIGDEDLAAIVAYITAIGQGQ